MPPQTATTMPEISGAQHALPQHIAPYLTDVLARLSAEDYLRGLDRHRLAERLAFYLAEINSVHPFREGNGRTQRAFIGQLAQDVGHRIAWERLDPERNIEVSQAAHRGNTEPLRALLADLIERL